MAGVFLPFRWVRLSLQMTAVSRYKPGMATTATFSDGTTVSSLYGCKRRLRLLLMSEMVLPRGFDNFSGGSRCTEINEFRVAEMHNRLLANGCRKWVFQDYPGCRL